MLFPSAGFLFVFLPVALAGFHLLGRLGRNAAIWWLAFISIAFYAAWRIEFVPLLLGSVLFNYLCAGLMIKTANRPATQRLVLVLGVACNLSVLIFYKYLFSILTALTSAGLIHRQWESLALPLGISFFTFTQIGYLIDLRVGAAEAHGLASYTLFVTFFPHLIAGPILHHKEIMPQFSASRRYRLNLVDFDAGLSWFILGLAKKLLLADQIAGYADALFNHPHGAGFWTAWGGALAYAMQLYFDFSGYSDMAIGLARMFSIQFPLNFNSPYKAKNIIDFWQRWHMTLTRYITLYLYNPLSLWVTRKRVAAGKSASKRALATPGGFTSLIAAPMMITMVLTGIWHGAGLQYVIYGLLHGCYLTINHAWRIYGPKLPMNVTPWKRSAATAASVLLTLVAVIVGQVFFRANSTRDALAVLAGMGGLHSMHLPHAVFAALTALRLPHPPEQLLLIVGMFVVVWTMPNTQNIMTRYQNLHIPGQLKAVVYSVLAYLVLFAATKPQSFIYFQF